MKSEMLPTLHNRSALVWLVLSLALAPGCSGDPDDNGAGGVDDAGDTPPMPNDVTPKLIAGGGVDDAPVGGELNVHVIDARTGVAIAGAAVRVGGASATAPITGTTSAAGLVELTDAALSGKQTVTASAAGYAPATWIGVNGANVTLPLAPTSAVPQATVAGTITGWGTLPGVSLGQADEYNLAVVLYTFLDDLNAPENQIPPPMDGASPANICLKTAVADDCSWRMNARTGAQLHYAVIVRGNTNGTNEDLSDDTYTLLGYAVGTPTTLAAGQNVASEALALVSAGAMTGLQVTFASAPGGLGEVVAIPMLDLAASGRVVLPLPAVTPAAASAMVPAAQGAFGGGVLEVVAIASPPGADEFPFSTTFARQVAGGTAALGAFPAPPTGLAAASGTYSFSAVAGASLHFATFSGADGRSRWNVVVLDGTTSFTLPALSPDPLPSGALELQISGSEVPGFNKEDFTIPAVTSAFTRASGDAVTFTH